MPEREHGAGRPEQVDEEGHPEDAQIQQGTAGQGRVLIASIAKTPARSAAAKTSLTSAASRADAFSASTWLLAWIIANGMLAVRRVRGDVHGLTARVGGQRAYPAVSSPGSPPYAAGMP